MYFASGGRSSGGKPADTKLYDILGVSSDASPDDIRKQYRKLAKEYHPDKNPDHGDRFKEISFAYEVLSNPDQRRVYDARGMDGIKEGGGAGGGGFSHSDIFSKIFGGGGGGMFGGDDDDDMGGMEFLLGGRRNRRRKFQDTVHPLNVTLEDVFNGKTSKLKLSKRVLCSSCKGSGGLSGKKYGCSPCNGRGMRMEMRQIGPGMIQQFPSRCEACRGTGGTVPDSEKCKTCSGEKCKQEQKILEVNVMPGMQHNEKIVFEKEGDQAQPDVEPGDVVIVLQVREHDTFKRQGDDLHVEKTISLNEALCGFEFLVKHLDGSHVIIRQKAGEVIRPGTVRGVLGQGMPKKKYQQLRGNFYVHFDVKFPDAHFLEDESKYKVLQSLFPRCKNITPPANATEVSLMEYDEKKYSRGRGGEAYNDDSDEEGGPGMHAGPGGVRCQQQ